MLGIYFLDVGQGDCSFILGQAPDSAVMVDCRDATVAQRFIEDHGIVHLNAIVVSHLDKDHIEGLLPFLKNTLGISTPTLSVGKVFIDWDRPAPSALALELLNQLLEWDSAGKFKLEPVRRATDPVTVCQGTDWRIQIVLPFHSRVLKHRIKLSKTGEPNQLSAVIRVERAGVGVLIAGDAELPSWEDLENASLKADVIRSPHHGGKIGKGSRLPDANALYRAISPKVAVFSVGPHSGYKHPLPAHIQAALPCHILCTQLTEQCHARRTDVREGAITQAGAVFYPYRYRNTDGTERITEVPCAGSILIRIDERGTLDINPSATGWHSRFIARLDQPMCQLTPPK